MTSTRTTFDEPSRHRPRGSAPRVARGWGWVLQQAVDTAGDVAFERADGFGVAVAADSAGLQVDAGRFVHPFLGDGDAVDGGVQSPVAAGVESEPLGVARRRWDRCGTGVHRIRG